MAKKITGKSQKKIAKKEVVEDMSPIKDGTEVKIQGGVVRMEELPNVLLAEEPGETEYTQKEHIRECDENTTPASGMEVMLRLENEDLRAKLKTYQTADAKTEVAVDPKPPAETHVSHHCTCPDCGGPMAKGK